MSHLRCPVCGKNAALSTWRPETYEDDILVTSFKGLGRAGGFSRGKDESVLGDDDITPRMFSRLVELIRMIIDDNSDYRGILLSNIPLQVKPGEEAVVPASLYRGLQANLIQTQNQLSSAESKARSYELGEQMARNELDEYKERERTDSRVDKIISWFLRKSKVDIVENERYGFSLLVYPFPPELFTEFKNFSVGMSEEVRSRLQARIKPANKEMRFILNELLFKRRKTISEKMMDGNFLLPLN